MRGKHSPASGRGKLKHAPPRILTVAALIAASLFAQNQHPVTGRKYAGVMGAGGADWLVRPERAEEEQPDKAIALLGIAKGDGGRYRRRHRVHDVAPGGAGGSHGKVYANDIQPEMLRDAATEYAAAQAHQRGDRAGPVRRPQPAGDTMDLVLLVDVYHEFSEPQQMLRRIREALKPDGRLVLLEYRGEDPSVPIRPEHKMTVAQVKAELEPEGYRLDRVLEDLPRQHILIFKRTP